MSLVGELPGYLQIFSDGSVKRFAPEIVEASPESSNGYKSKDVTIDPSKQITARLFVSVAEGSPASLPVLVYFHGGGFCIGSPTWGGYHHFLGDLSAVSKTIILAVDYRLAPENRLPAAYDDCFQSLEWLSHQVNTEPFLAQADISQVFLSGDSAGGNITHHVAIKALRNSAIPVKIKAVLPLHPFFGSEKRTEKEIENGPEGAVAMNDLIWGLSIPEGSNRDYFGCNYEKQDISADEWQQFPPVLIFVAGLDFLKERGERYAEFLQKKGVKEVQLIETADEPHVFFVFHPESQATRLLQQQMIAFMKSHLGVGK